MPEGRRIHLIESRDAAYLTAVLQDADEDDARIRVAVADPVNTSYVVLAGEQPAGAVVMRWGHDESEIVYIAVDAGVRGQGLGKHALQLVAEEARRRKAAALVVGTSNASLGTIAFYQKCGYRIDAVRRDYFNYFRAPVFEDGIQIRDMLMLRLELEPTRPSEPARTPYPARRWDVLLIGGASGVGKSSISYRVAQHFGIALIEVDDFLGILERMTTPEQQPELHFWNTHPDPTSLPPEVIAEQGIVISEVMLPALEAVIANHLETDRPAVLEGDFILPALARYARYGDIPNGGRVRAVFIDEPDEAQILANYLAREPDAGPQAFRARVSVLHNARLKQMAAQYGLICLPARPWDTLFERLCKVLN